MSESEPKSGDNIVGKSVSNASNGKEKTKRKYSSKNVCSRVLSSRTVFQRPNLKELDVKGGKLLNSVGVELPIRGSDHVISRMVIDVDKNVENPQINLFIHGEGSARVQIIQVTEPEEIDLTTDSPPTQTDLLTDHMD